MNPAEYAKAIVGGILAGLAVLATSLTDGAVSPAEIVGIAIATLTTFTTVWGVPNASEKKLVTQHVLSVTEQDVEPAHVDASAAAKILDGL